MPNDMQRTAWTEISGPRWVAQRNMYDRMLAPFQAAVIDALNIEFTESILDVGCGYGTTTLAVADRVDRAATVVRGVDISPAMIDHARERAGEHSHASFAVADAQTDPLGGQVGGQVGGHGGGPDGGHGGGRGFEAAISRFGVMFFDDPTAAFANIAAAMARGGRMAFVCWQAVPLNPFFTMGRHIRALVTDPPPLPDATAPGPAAFADADRTAGLLQAAGWENLDFRSITPTIRFDLATGDDGIDNAMTLVAGSEAGSLAVKHLSPVQQEIAYAAVRENLVSYLVDGAIAVPSAAWIVTGSVPG